MLHYGILHVIQTESLVIQIESFVILDESHEIHDKSHEPHVEGIRIPVEEDWYDTVDEAIDMYSKYAEMRGFEVKKSGQRLTKSGVVKHKYIMCNRE
ncbi:hypothetical protein Tco_0293700, partial [Tanacetum coccineum]